MDKYSEQKVYAFDQFRLDGSHRILSRNGKELDLAPKAVETLLALVEMNGKVLSKDELLSAVWPDTIVEESNLFTYLSHLRKALGHRKDGKPYVETLRRRGYRFTGDVRVLTEFADGPIPHLHDAAAIPKHATTDPIKLSSNSGSVVVLAEWLKDDAQPANAEADQEVNELPKLRIVPAAHRDRKGIVAAIVVGSLILGAIGLYLFSSSSPPANNEIRSVAVLPFKTLVADPQSEMLELGMADALITKLNTVSDITVRPLSSVIRFKGLDQDSLSAGQRLNVDAVLESNIQTADGRIRISVKLLSTKDGRQVWTQNFEEEFSGVLKVQDDMAEKIALCVTPQLSTEVRASLAKHGTDSVQAWQLYVTGRLHVARLILPETEKGIADLNRAVELDPN